MMDYDEAKLQQILQNLISNAIKFTPEYGTVKVFADKFKKGRIEFLKLTIADTGPGIPAEHLNHIFDRFYRFPRLCNFSGDVQDFLDSAIFGRFFIFLRFCHF